MLWKMPPGGLAHQAATGSSALTGNSVKIPSSNRTPSISKPIRFLSSIQRTPALTQPQRHLEHQVQRAVSSLHPSSDIRPQPHSAEHRLHRVRRPQMHPMLEWEVVEAHERLPVPKHRVCSICSDRPLSDRKRTRPSSARTPLASAHTTSPQLPARLRVQRLRQLRLHVQRTVVPAPLMTRSREHRIQRSPQPQRTVSHRQ